MYHNACHIAADKIHGVVWFHHAIQPSLTCHCPDTGTGIGPHTSVRRKYQPSPTACALCPLQEPYTLSKVILNFSRIIIYAYTLTQHSAGVERELLTTHTFCRQSSMSLISQSYSHEVVCSIVTSSGSDWLLSPLMSPKNPPLPRQMAGYTPKEQLHRKPLLCVGMLPKEAELLLLLFYFHLLFSPWVSSLVCHPIHILLPCCKLSAPFNVLQRGTHTEVTHKVTQSISIEEFVFAACLLLFVLCMFLVVINAPKPSESSERWWEWLNFKTQVFMQLWEDLRANGSINITTFLFTASVTSHTWGMTLLTVSRKSSVYFIRSKF